MKNLEELRNKIAKWFNEQEDLDRSCKVAEVMDTGNENDKICALWDKKNTQFYIDIMEDADNNYMVFSKGFALYNQTEDNIIALLSCLKNHINSN